MVPSRLTAGRSQSRTVLAENARSRGRAVEPVPCCAATAAARLIPRRLSAVLFHTSVVSTVISFHSPVQRGYCPGAGEKAAVPAASTLIAHQKRRRLPSIPLRAPGTGPRVGSASQLSSSEHRVRNQNVRSCCSSFASARGVRDFDASRLCRARLLFRFLLRDETGDVGAHVETGLYR